MANSLTVAGPMRSMILIAAFKVIRIIVAPN
jgi:hypothetical protein